MSPRKAQRKDRNERREEILRPSPYLGYDRDQLAVHLMRREAFEIAESQFRRAIWLNPYEPVFKQHLAWCLYCLRRYAEARHWIGQGLEQDPNNAVFQRTLAVIDRELANTGPGSSPAKSEADDESASPSG